MAWVAHIENGCPARGGGARLTGDTGMPEDRASSWGGVATLDRQRQ
jgi:hypothetical protein